MDQEEAEIEEQEDEQKTYYVEFRALYCITAKSAKAAELDARELFFDDALHNDIEPRVSED